MNSSINHDQGAATDGGHRGWRYQLANIDCMRASVPFNVVMDLTEDIGDHLSYPAALLPNCT